MRAATLLELGRVSNLPTVWSNVVAGAILSNGEPQLLPLLLVSLAGTAFYVGGMFLNDAFDADIDARERPERPIPSGRASRGSVFRIGLGLLAFGLALLAFLVSLGLAASPLGLLSAGAATASFVVFYDRWHKGYAWSPVVMGLCRAGLYVMGALVVTERLGAPVVAGAAAILLYVVGLTHLARFETASRLGRAWPVAFVFGPATLAVLESLRDGSEQSLLSTWWAIGIWVFAVLWCAFSIRLARRGGRDIGRAVIALIAGISLADAVLMSSVGGMTGALAATGAFLLTLLGQRVVRGT